MYIHTLYTHVHTHPIHTLYTHSESVTYTIHYMPHTYTGYCTCSILCLFSPAGVFEMEKFAAGSKGILEAMVEATSKGATTIIGNI